MRREFSNFIKQFFATLQNPLNLSDGLLSPLLLQHKNRMSMHYKHNNQQVLINNQFFIAKFSSALALSEKSFAKQTHPVSHSYFLLNVFSSSS